MSLGRVDSTGGGPRTVFESYHGKRLLFASFLRPLAERLLSQCGCAARGSPRVVSASARSSGRGSARRREPAATFRCTGRWSCGAS